MTASTSQFVGEIPGAYDSGLGPNIFVDYATDIAARASALKPSRVLEVAAGTGIVSRKLRDALPADVPLTITDLNAPMLDVARAKFSAGENVAFAVIDAMKIGAPDASVDLLVCQFGVMFFPDKQASFRETLRVLTPDGTYLFNTWGAMADNPYAAIAQDVCATHFPDNPPTFYRTPFSCADADPVIADLKAAGFGRVAHETVVVQKHVADVPAFARALVHGNPLIAEINARGGAPDAVVAAIEQRLRDMLGPSATMPLKANVFSARR